MSSGRRARIRIKVRRCVAGDRADEVGELVGGGVVERLGIEQVERGLELGGGVLGSLADDEHADIASRCRAGELDRLGEPTLADQHDGEVAGRIRRLVERERATEQALGDDGGGRLVGIVLERDLDQHAGELATAPRALTDRPGERRLLAVAAEPLGERVAGEHERLGVIVGIRARLDRSSTASNRAHASGSTSLIRATIHSRK